MHSHVHANAGWGPCSRCGCMPCRCGMGLLFAPLKMGAGLMSALKAACQPSCGCATPCEPSIIVHALPGERRVVPFQVKNDTACPVTVRPEVKAWSLCGCEEPETDLRPMLENAEPAEIPACGTHSFDIILETKGLKPCRCYCATLTLTGTCCHPVTLMLCIGGKVPAVCRHDTSRLRAWVRSCCFTWGPGYVAPPALVSGCAP